MPDLSGRRVILIIIGLVAVSIIIAPAFAPKPPRIGTDDIQDGAVTTPKLADGAVTSLKIADHSIGLEDVAFMNVIRLNDDAEGNALGWDPDGVTTEFFIHLGVFAEPPLVGPIIAGFPEPSAGDCVPPDGVGAGDQVFCQVQGELKGLIQTPDDEFIGFIHFPEPPDGGYCFIEIGLP
jgi:hypothetical protein